VLLLAANLTFSLDSLLGCSIAALGGSCEVQRSSQAAAWSDFGTGVVLPVLSCGVHSTHCVLWVGFYGSSGCLVMRSVVPTCFCARVLALCLLVLLQPGG
jgi:hypothetical protein